MDSAEQLRTVSIPGLTVLQSPALIKHSSCAEAGWNLTLQDGEPHFNLNQTQSALFINVLKGTVHPKMKIASAFTLPQVDTNLYACVCSEHNGRYFEESLLFWGTIDFHSRRKILLCFPHSSEYLPLCSEQTHSYRFGST